MGEIKERPNLNELAKEIHNDNKLKGFHDVDWSDEHCLMLAICELCEAIEADRNGKTFQDESVCNDFDHFYRKESDLGFRTAFLEDIKDSVSDELADFVIRLLDLAGKKGYNEFDEDFGEILIDDISFTENILIIVDIIRDKRFDLYLNIETAINNVEMLCKHLNIDLWLHVDLKLKYNKTRPYKHGKEY